MKSIGKSGFFGVRLASSGKKWRARIYIARKEKHIGNFDTSEEAAIAYNEAAKKFIGDKARLNVLENN